MKAPRRTGTQSIERAILLLKAVATRGPTGWRLTELAGACGLDKSTAHRLLECLRAERLIERDEKSQRFFPGPLISELGLSAPACRPLFDECAGVLARLARRTGAASFLYLASGSEFVVASRVEYAVHSNLMHQVGWRRPLISSVGGVAILIGLPEQERALIVEANLAQLRRTGRHHNAERLRQMLERSLEEGFASNLEEAAAGVHSFAVGLEDANGRPFAAISIADAAHVLPAASRMRLAELLRAECAALERDPGTGMANALRARTAAPRLVRERLADTLARPLQ
jgi:DNA-binding IclR family transcriptional regulator